MLVIEDHRDTADSMQMLLGLMGHEVAVATNGPDGLRMAREWAPRVVLCDIALPGLDGYEVARRLRADPATDRLALIAITGYGHEADRQRSRAAGFDIHLVKPVEPADLDRLLLATPE
ncbi:MAG TPA: response regulator [Gemmataceae bacterium]|nr:response regulator [Gemmataceae bacterium]